MSDDPLRTWAKAAAPEAEENVHGGGSVPKQAVVYLHVMPGDMRLPHRGADYQTQYQCHDCPWWVPARERCVLHAEGVRVTATMSCGYWMPGKPQQQNARALGFLMPEESALADSPPGFSCKRCAQFIVGEPGACAVVDRNSAGSDPGEIHPEACCAGWGPA